MVNRLVAEAGRTGAAVGAAARHLAWYLTYLLDLGDASRSVDARRTKSSSRRRKR